MRNLCMKNHQSNYEIKIIKYDQGNISNFLEYIRHQKQIEFGYIYFIDITPNRWGLIIIYDVLAKCIHAVGGEFEEMKTINEDIPGLINCIMNDTDKNEYILN